MQTDVRIDAPNPDDNKPISVEGSSHKKVLHIISAVIVVFYIFWIIATAIARRGIPKEYRKGMSDKTYHIFVGYAIISMFTYAWGFYSTRKDSNNRIIRIFVIGLWAVIGLTFVVVAVGGKEHEQYDRVCNIFKEILHFGDDSCQTLKKWLRNILQIVVITCLLLPVHLYSIYKGYKLSS